MKVVDKKIVEYINLLASGSPAPGGGSASALLGAQAMGLTSMVAEFTIGRDKYAEYEDIAVKVKKSSHNLIEEFLNNIDEDTKAFNEVALAYKMAKNTVEEKALRSLAIAEAMKKATLVPYSVLKNAYDGLKATENLIGKSNINVYSDLGVAAINLKGCAQSAYLNVCINLSSLNDKELSSKLKEECDSILDKVNNLSDTIYEEVKKSLL